MWELRVEGRLLDEPPAAALGATSGSQNRTQPAKRKFSSFFKSLVIELDKDIYGPDNHLVEWHRTPQTNETDGFQVHLSFIANLQFHAPCATFFLFKTKLLPNNTFLHSFGKIRNRK